MALQISPTTTIFHAGAESNESKTQTRNQCNQKICFSTRRDVLQLLHPRVGFGAMPVRSDWN
jgi:hypothetical protein